MCYYFICNLFLISLVSYKNKLHLFTFHNNNYNYLFYLIMYNNLITYNII